MVVAVVGNRLRGDDAAGPLVCESLQGRVSAKVIDAGTVPENFIRPVILARPENLLIVDAVDCGEAPGTARVFKSDEVGGFAFSTHALSFHLFADIVQQEVSLDVASRASRRPSCEISGSIRPLVQAGRT